MNKAFHRWWIYALGLSVIGFWCVYLGLPSLIWHGDASHTTLINIAWFIGSSLYAGYLTWNVNKMNPDRLLAGARFLKFASTSSIYIGIFGTAVGFILMMAIGLAGVNFADQSAIIKLIGYTVTGLGTALYTTAVGVASSWLLSLQHFNLTQQMERNLEQDE